MKMKTRIEGEPRVPYFIPGLFFGYPLLSKRSQNKGGSQRPPLRGAVPLRLRIPFAALLMKSRRAFCATTCVVLMQKTSQKRD